MIYFLFMKEFAQSALLAGALTFSPSIGHSPEANFQDYESHQEGHHQTIAESHDGKFWELDDLTTELKLAVTLAGISLVAGKYATTKRFVMHSEDDQNLAAWTSFATWTAASALVIFETWL